MVQRETLNINQILVLGGVTICHAYRKNNAYKHYLSPFRGPTVAVGKQILYIYPAQRVVLDFYGQYLCKCITAK